MSNDDNEHDEPQTTVEEDIAEGIVYEIDLLLRDVVFGGLYQEEGKPDLSEEQLAAAFFIGLKKYVENPEAALSRIYVADPPDPLDVN